MGHFTSRLEDETKFKRVGYMINLKDFIAENTFFRKLKVDDLLFAEFQCPSDGDATALWWHHNFFAFVIRGETLIKTLNGVHILTPGSCVFARKGSVISQTRSHDDFCEMIVFLPDEFIKSIVQKYPIQLNKGEFDYQTVIEIKTDEVLKSYFYSLLSYLNLKVPPNSDLMKLKFEELIVHLLTSGKHPGLHKCFADICASTKTSIRAIMEANFSRNLTLEEYARMCARSLTAFKEEFKTLYHIPPGKWLRQKRLEQSCRLLKSTNHLISEIAFQCGFQSPSHFSRVFKMEFGVSPSQFRHTSDSSIPDHSRLTSQTTILTSQDN